MNRGIAVSALVLLVAFGASPCWSAADLPASFVYVKAGKLWLQKPGQPEARVITSPDFASPSSPVFLDASGDRFLFSAYRFHRFGRERGSIDIAEADIWTGSVDGCERFAKTDGVTLSPDVTRDGRKIAFTSNRHAVLRNVMPRSNSIEIYWQRKEWNLAKRVTRDEGSKYSPRWSPDGSRLAYLLLKGDQSGIYVLDVEKDEAVRISASGNFPTWSPDGKALAFADRGRIFVIDATAIGGERKTEPLEVAPEDFVSFLRWTDHGLLFQWSRKGGEQGISLLDPETGASRVLVSGREEFGGSDLAPRAPWRGLPPK